MVEAVSQQGSISQQEGSPQSADIERERPTLERHAGMSAGVAPIPAANVSDVARARSRTVSLAPDCTVAHFWICSTPIGESLLLSCPLAGGVPPAELDGNNILLRLYDADGYHCNEISIQTPPSRLGVFELEPFLAACKFESGIRHAHLEVVSPPTWRHSCRIITQEGATLVGEPVRLRGAHREFFPVTCAAGPRNSLASRAGRVRAVPPQAHTPSLARGDSTISRDSSMYRDCLVCLVNYSPSAAIVRGRFFCGKRSPEGMWHIPAHGCRLISLATEFADYLDLGDQEALQAYIRLGVRGDYEVGAQLIERTSGSHGGMVVSALA